MTEKNAVVVRSEKERNGPAWRTQTSAYGLKLIGCLQQDHPPPFRVVFIESNIQVYEPFETYANGP